MRKITRSLIFSLTLYRTNDAIKYNLLYEFLRKKKWVDLSIVLPQII